MGGHPLGIHPAFGNRLKRRPPPADAQAEQGRKGAAPVDENRVDDSLLGGAPASATAGPAGTAGASEEARRPSPHDLEVLSRQLGRPVRDVVEIPARCICGNPLVAATSPRLSTGTPFPTTFYLTHPVITSAVSRLEAAGLMNQMNERLAGDADLAGRYRAAHEAYLASRAEIGARSGTGAVPEIDGVSAGGMPTRVKCLHVLVGHSLAAGPGVNPLGDEALAGIAEWWTRGRCYCDGAWDTGGEVPSQDLSRHGPQGLPDIVGRPAPVRPARTTHAGVPAGGSSSGTAGSPEAGQ
jgi:uncharacterized protein